MPPSNEPRRFCFALDLHDDPVLIARYKTWHAPGTVPAPVIEAMRTQGIQALEIYNYGDRLFMIMEAGPEYDPAAAAIEDAANPAIVAWQDLMWEFQKPLATTQKGQKWASMTRIFALDQD